MERILRTARLSGTLNLSGRDLSSVPDGVYQIQATIDPDEKWWEVVDLQKLTLSHNVISVLDDSLGGLVTLTLLDLSYNKLTSLPATMGSIQALKSLDISNNSVDCLPESLSELASLVRLSCGSNQLTALPHNLGRCSELVEFKVPNNRLAALPANLHHLSKLMTLDLEGNLLPSLPDGIFAGLLSLTDLNISKNVLASVPACMGALSSLRRLDLRQNKLTTLPLGLGRCAKLAELYLGLNNLRQLPEDFASLSKLSTLDVRDNQLKEYPAALCSLSLSLLDLSNNDLSGLPAELGFMTSLRRLVLDGNALRSLRSSLVSGPTSNLLAYLRSRVASEEDFKEAPKASSGNIFAADLSHQLATAARTAASSGVLSLVDKGLKEVPPEAWEAGGSITTLDLSRNKISSLSGELRACTALTGLLLSDNAFIDWPAPGLSGVPTLRTLSLARNPLRVLPDNAFSLASLQALRSLDLTGTRAALPLGPALSCLSHLEELRLGQTNLQDIPSDLAQLSALRILDVSQCRLTAVPEFLGGMTSLEELDLSNNDISALPPQLGLLESSLRSLKVEGNPLRTDLTASPPDYAHRLTSIVFYGPEFSNHSPLSTS